MHSNVTGRAYNTEGLVIPDGSFTWKTDTNGQGKNILVLQYDHDRIPHKCYFKERKYSESIIKMVLYQNYDENDNPVGHILIKNP